MDEIDSLSEREAFFNKQVIQGIQATIKAKASTEGAEVCEECGDEIPQARRLASPGCTLCVFCQDEYERGRNAEN